MLGSREDLGGFERDETFGVEGRVSPLLSLSVNPRLDYDDNANLFAGS